MADDRYKQIFTPEKLAELLPADTADHFFEALYGDKKEGAYDICLEYKGAGEDSLLFEFHLKQRKGKCLACNLTYGLPTVFARHPIINVKGLVDNIAKEIGVQEKMDDFKLGSTKEISSKLHIVPLIVSLKNGKNGAV